MAAEISGTLSTRAFRFHRSPLIESKENSFNTPFRQFSPLTNPPFIISPLNKNATSTVVFFAYGRTKEGFTQVKVENMDGSRDKMKLRSDKLSYLIAAHVSSIGIISMAVFAVYFRFSWRMEGENVPVTEILGTFAFAVASAIGMEFLSRWTHRALWHTSLWHIHKSHHRQREGPFELNDVFAIINAVPAIALLNFGFFHEGLVPGLCYGAGLGMTVIGMAYIFVHNGLVHRRFPVGSIADVPYLHKVAAAHQIHHSHKFQGVPYGLFLGPKELEEVGGTEELQKEINRRIRMNNSRQNS